jgi:UDP-N-acetylglucosamine 4,6-dehydratase/5-epimerase
MDANVFCGRSILITGGTGSFGRGIVAHLLEAHCNFARLVVFSRDEMKQYEMQQQFPDPRLRFVIGDVRDRDRLTNAMKGCDFVIHAAALKHVPIAEYNPIECVKTNIHGAENVIAAALANKVLQVMALSTDKAVNPASLYGATKLCSDKLFVAANNLTDGEATRFSVTRCGNIIGSRGSVLPLFRKLVAEEAPALPITDGRMTRFWATLDQCVDFILQNFERMWGGEIFVAKTPSIRIVDLAAAVAPHFPIKVIGIRPGEKLHEIMCPLDDSHLTITFPDYFIIKPPITYFDWATDYRMSRDGVKGSPMGTSFEYSSGTNDHFLTVQEIAQLNARL